MLLLLIQSNCDGSRITSKNVFFLISKEWRKKKFPHEKISCPVHLRIDVHTYVRPARLSMTHFGGINRLRFLPAAKPPCHGMQMGCCCRSSGWQPPQTDLSSSWGAKFALCRRRSLNRVCSCSCPLVVLQVGFVLASKHLARNENKKANGKKNHVFCVCGESWHGKNYLYCTNKHRFFLCNLIFKRLFLR